MLKTEIWDFRFLSMVWLTGVVFYSPVGWHDVRLTDVWFQENTKNYTAFINSRGSAAVLHAAVAASCRILSSAIVASCCVQCRGASM